MSSSARAGRAPRRHGKEPSVEIPVEQVESLGRSAAAALAQAMFRADTEGAPHGFSADDRALLAQLPPAACLKLLEAYPPTLSDPAPSVAPPKSQVCRAQQ